MDDAIELAETEAQKYAETNGYKNTELVQAFHIASSVVGSSTEVFSLIRGSHLAASDYLDTFFDTGTELQTDSTGEAAPDPAAS